MPMKRKVTIDVKESVESGKKVFVRYQEGAELYSVGLHTFQNWAKDAGAVYKIKGVALVNTELLDKYLEAFRI